MKYLKHFESFEDDIKQIDSSVVDRDSLHPYEDIEDECDCECDDSDNCECDKIDEDINPYEIVDQQNKLQMIILKFEQDFGRMPLFKLQNTDNDEVLLADLTKIADEFFDTNDFDEVYKNDFIKHLMAERANMFANNIQPSWDKGRYYKKTIM